MTGFRLPHLNPRMTYSGLLMRQVSDIPFLLEQRVVGRCHARGDDLRGLEQIIESLQFSILPTELRESTWYSEPT